MREVCRCSHSLDGHRIGRRALRAGGRLTSKVPSSPALTKSPPMKPTLVLSSSLSSSAASSSSESALLARAWKRLLPQCPAHRARTQQARAPACANRVPPYPALPNP